jgi:hypothetical protein
MRATVVALLGTALAACGPEGGREGYAGDGDTGAAAPATTPTFDAPGGPDSTTGVSERTGEKGPAGDRQAQNSTAAIPGTPAAGQDAAKAARASAPLRGKADSGGRKPDSTVREP